MTNTILVNEGRKILLDTIEKGNFVGSAGEDLTWISDFRNLHPYNLYALCQLVAQDIYDLLSNDKKLHQDSPLNYGSGLVMFAGIETMGFVVANNIHNFLIERLKLEKGIQLGLIRINPNDGFKIYDYSDFYGPKNMIHVFLIDDITITGMDMINAAGALHNYGYEVHTLYSVISRIQEEFRIPLKTFGQEKRILSIDHLLHNTDFGLEGR